MMKKYFNSSSELSRLLVLFAVLYLVNFVFISRPYMERPVIYVRAPVYWGIASQAITGLTALY